MCLVYTRRVYTARTARCTYRARSALPIAARCAHRPRAHPRTRIYILVRAYRAGDGAVAPARARAFVRAARVRIARAVRAQHIYVLCLVVILSPAALAPTLHTVLLLMMADTAALLMTMLRYMDRCSLSGLLSA